MTSIHIPAEWAPHQALWTAWPSDPLLWDADLEPAREEVAAMIKALSGDRWRVLAANEEALANAKRALGPDVEVILAPFGDIWLRDIGPIFARIDGAPAALGFRFNGWGGKYQLDGDDGVAAQIAAAAQVPLRASPFILEGGAIEMDGAGTVLTTRQCLLNPNRNIGWDQATAERHLAAALGAKKVLWLDEGLANDHTDGHVDNLARFVGQGRVVCQAPYGASDPNAAVLTAIAAALESFTDAAGRKLEVIQIPSPGLVEDEEGDSIPASHMNFVIGNEAVAVPIYSDSGDDAVKALAPLFPGRRVVGLSAHAILTGGGSFHCITQQEPA
jgi:agmatine deiminase